MAVSREKPGPFEARASWPKTLLYALGGLLMVAASVAVIRIGGAVGLVAGVIGAGFFGLCTLIILRQLFYIGPVIAIGPDGIVCRQWSDQLIPWRAFKRAKAPMGSKMISFWLVDPDAYPTKFVPGLFRKLDPDRLNNGDLALMTMLLDRSYDDLAEAIYTHRPSLFRRR